MRFKKPFKAVPIKPDPDYLAKRDMRLGQSRARTTAPPAAASQPNDIAPVTASPPIPRQRKRRRHPDRPTSRTLLASAAIGVVAGLGIVAIERGALEWLHTAAKDAGLIRARDPQPGDYWASCDAARLAGSAPLSAREHGYRAELDRDGDGIACEWYFGA